MSEDRFSNEKNQLSDDTGAPLETQTEWFVDINGQQHGPVTNERVLEFVTSGHLGPQDYVWCDGMEDWARLQDVSKLLDPTEQLHSVLESLPLSNVSERPIESVRQPDEVDISSSQNEIDSTPDTQNIEDAFDKDSSPLDAPNGVSQELQDGQLSAEREDDSLTENQSEPVMSENHDSLQPQIAEGPDSQDSEEGSEAVPSEALPIEDVPSEAVPIEASDAKDYAVVKTPTSFEVPKNNAFEIDNGAKPFDDSYSLHYLVMNALQTKGPEPPRKPDGYASDENSGLIDLRNLDPMEEGFLPAREPVRANPQFQQKFDSLLPTERLLAAEAKSNRPIKLAAAAGFGILALSTAASFLILSYEKPGQDSITSTSLAADVSSRELQNPLKEQIGEQVATQPPKASKNSAVPEIKAVSEQKARIRTKPVIAPIKKDLRIASLDKSASAKRAKPNQEQDNRKKQSPTQTRSTSKNKSEVSTDDLLNWAVGKGDKAPMPAATKDDSASTPRAEPKPEQPQQPSREETLAAIRSVTPSVKACGKGTGSLATAAISVEGSSGKVKQVKVTGVDTSIGKCVEKAVSRARFPRFSKEQFDIKYPFRL